MHVGDRKRPPLSPQEGWLSDGRQVLHFRPRRYDRWSQSLEVTFGEVMAGGAPPLLKRREELTREQAIKLWAQKRQQGCKPCPPQWKFMREDKQYHSPTRSRFSHDSILVSHRSSKPSEQTRSLRASAATTCHGRGGEHRQNGCNLKRDESSPAHDPCSRDCRQQ
ncbi:DUF1651 domain-containing protein [Vulcanococcus limneticus Candia 3F8]|uniref:DUF1651 domain-containing protein n=1 Tax=Vulcanococcus limneticus TaxID=2170428 RepID=UPI0020CED8F2|nr:DUF1651 domain-containing protein [Vulcanococcus limneticus]MCP9894640.1 DUF1651 domain-containing protein [Vulcanococcus limneticus Candia 3F8]